MARAGLDLHARRDRRRALRHQRGDRRRPTSNKNTPSDRLFQLAAVRPAGVSSARGRRSRAATRARCGATSIFGSLDGTDHRGYLSLRERVSRRVTRVRERQLLAGRRRPISSSQRPAVPADRRALQLAAGGIEARAHEEHRPRRPLRDDVGRFRPQGHGPDRRHGQRPARRAHAPVQRARVGRRRVRRRAGPTSTRGPSSSSFQDAGGVFRYRTGEAHDVRRVGRRRHSSIATPTTTQQRSVRRRPA